MILGKISILLAFVIQLASVASCTGRNDVVRTSPLPQSSATLNVEICRKNPAFPGCAELVEASEALPLVFDKIRPLNSAKGGAIRIYGAEFDEDLKLEIEGANVPLIRLGTNEAAFFSPAFSDDGVKKGILQRREQSFEFSYYYTNASASIAEEYASVADVCQGQTRLLTDGQTVEGATPCAEKPVQKLCTSDGAKNCVAADSFPAASLSTLLPGNIKNGVTLGGVKGSYPSVSTPLAGADPTADLDADGFAIKLSSATSFEWFGPDGTRYTGAGDPGLLAGNIKFGVTLFGVAGAYAGLGVSSCSANGQQNCLASGSYFAATACAALGSNCYVPSYTLTTQPLKAISYDAIDMAKASIRSSVTLAGVTGTYEPDFPAAANVHGSDTVNGVTGTLTLPTASNVRSGNGAFGLAGNSVTPTLADCNADDLSGCVTTLSYKSANYANITAGNIKNGVTIGAVAGTYPSAATPLAANTGTNDLTAFGPAVAPGAYEFFDSSGNVYAAAVADGGTLTPSTSNQTLSTAGTMYRAVTVQGDAALTAGNIRTSATIFSVAGSYSGTGLAPSCGTDGEIGCTTVANFPALDKLAPALPGKILSGQTVVGIAGTYTPDFPDAANVRSSDTVNGASGALDNCAADGAFGCVVIAPTYAAAIVTGAASKLLATASLAGITGNVTLPAVGKVLTGTSYGVSGTSASGTLTLPAASNVFTGTGTYGDPGAALTPSYNPDFPAAANVHGSDTVNGVTGTLTLPTASNVRSGNGAFGLAGNSVTPTLADCNADDLSGCVTTLSYKSANYANITAGNIKNGVTIGAVAGTYPSAATPLAANTGTNDLTAFGPAVAPGAYEFFDSSGNVYAAAVADGGTLTPSTSNQTLSTAGTMYRAVTVQGDVDLVAAKILSGIDIFGITGVVTPAPANCSSNGQQSCVASGSYYAAISCTLDGSNCFVPSYAVTTQPLKAISYDAINSGKASIRTNLTLSGIAGTLADCSANDVTGCVTTAGYKSADWTNLTATNIKNGATIAGVTGNYPSSGNLLSVATATADLDFATFNAKIKSSASFEWFGPDGARYTNTGTTNITDINIANGISIFGTTGTFGTNCTGDGQISCLTTAIFKSMDTSALSNWDIRYGKTAGGITGRIFFENGGTKDDYNNGGAIPSQRMDAYGLNNWTILTVNQAYKDEITQLTWTRDPGNNYTVAGANTYCANLVTGGFSDWRMPTLKELMQSYINGIWRHEAALNLWSDRFSYDYWSTTIYSTDITKNWYMAQGGPWIDGYDFDAGNYGKALCVR